jgi:hypothetical protein
VQSERAVRALLGDCRRLLSERGEANSPAIATDIVGELDHLTDEQRDALADALGGLVDVTNRECEAMVAAECAAVEADLAPELLTDAP